MYTLVHENTHAAIDAVRAEAETVLPKIVEQIADVALNKKRTFGDLYDAIKGEYPSEEAAEELLAYAIQRGEMRPEVRAALLDALDPQTRKFVEDRILKRIYGKEKLQTVYGVRQLSSEDYGNDERGRYAGHSRSSEEARGERFEAGEGKKSASDKPITPSGNRLVSEERYQELKKRMIQKFGGQFNMGVDPEILAIGTEMAVYHIEKGARKFAAYAKAMIADLGDFIRPYLKSFYNAVRDMPEAEAAGLVADMDSYEDVRRVDIANFDKTGVDAMATAAAVVAEQEAETEREEAEVILDCSVDDFDSLGHRHLLDGIGGEFLHLFLGQIIDEVGLFCGGLHRESFLLGVDDKAVAAENLLPLLVGEIDIGGDGILVRNSRFGRSLGLRNWLDDCLHLRENILLRNSSLNRSLGRTFIIKAVAAGLHFTGLLAPVGTHGHHGSACGEPQLATDAAHVPSLLISRCPAEEAPAEGMAVHHAEVGDTTVFTDTDAVAVETHGDAAVGVAGVNEVTRQIEVCGHHRGERVVGTLVGGVGAPVDDGAELLLSDGIVEKRRVVTLDNKLKAVARPSDRGSHAVAHEDVLKLGMQFEMVRIGVLSDSHRRLGLGIALCHCFLKDVFLEGDVGQCVAVVLRHAALGEELVEFLAPLGRVVLNVVDPRE